MYTTYIYQIQIRGKQNIVTFTVIILLFRQCNNRMEENKIAGHKPQVSACHHVILKVVIKIIMLSTCDVWMHQIQQPGLIAHRFVLSERKKRRGKRKVDKVPCLKDTCTGLLSKGNEKNNSQHEYWINEDLFVELRFLIVQNQEKKVPNYLHSLT